MPPTSAAAADPYLARLLAGAGVATGVPMTPATANATRLAYVIWRAAEVLKGGGAADQLGQLCRYISRSIDYAIAINDVPQIADHLPPLVKQIYKQRNNTSIQVQAAITVLLISIKSAIKNGWFHTADANELLNMANESCGNFCMTSSIATEMSHVLDTILKIIPRFYPQLKLCRLIASFEAKPGYNCLMADFDIPRNGFPEEKIMLFVAENDNTETSSCLKTPPNASFLVNGIGVQKRTNVSLDNGPQFPSDITKMLEYGSNSIQVVGYFTGNYIIAITSMGKAAPTPTHLADYVHPTVTALDPDSEIVEGASEVSLNCPLSLSRIKLPVKGHLCKHHQCFDYDNFLEMNSKKPSWRCPCCNQPVSCVDLCIDQRMVKILSEVGDDTSNVTVSCDGFWKAVVHNNTGDQVVDRNSKCESSMTSDTSPKSIDLTIEEDHGVSATEVEDRKPVVRGLCIPDSAQGESSPSLTDICPRTWVSVFTSCDPSVSTVPTNPHRDGSLHSLISNYLPNPSATNATALDQASLQFSQSALSSRHVSRNRQVSENTQLRHPFRGSSIISNETERPHLPRHVNGTPVTVQPLPAQVQALNLSGGTHAEALNYGSSFFNGSSVSHQTLPSVQANQDGFSRTGTTAMHQISRILGRVPSPIQPHMMTQDGQYPMNPALRQQLELQATACNNPTRALSDQQRGVGAYRTELRPPFDRQDFHQLQNLQGHQSTSQRSSTCQHYHGPSRQIPQMSHNAATMIVQNANNHPNQSFSVQHAAQVMEVQHVHSSATATVQPSIPMMADCSRLSGYNQLLEEVGTAPSFHGIPGQTWRPAGRMRGSLTGSAYSAALDQYRAQPGPPAHARPPLPPNVASIVIDSSINALRSQAEQAI